MEMVGTLPSAGVCCIATAFEVVKVNGDKICSLEAVSPLLLSEDEESLSSLELKTQVEW